MEKERRHATVVIEVVEGASAPAERGKNRTSLGSPRRILVCETIADTVVTLGYERVYECVYRLVSISCLRLRLVATPARPICSIFLFVAFGGSSFARTFNPKVAGS